MPEFKVKLSGDNSDLKGKLDQTIQQFNTLGSGVGLGGFPGRLAQFVANPLTAVAAALGAIVFSIRAAVREAHEVTRIAERANLTGRQAGALKMGAERTGMEPSELAAMQFRFQRAVGAARLDPEGEMARSLQAFGFSIKEITNSNEFDLFMKLLDNLSKSHLSAEQTAAGFRLMRANIGELSIAAHEGLGGNIKEAMQSPLLLTNRERYELEELRKQAIKAKAVAGEAAAKVGSGETGFLRQFGSYIALLATTPIFGGETQTREELRRQYLGLPPTPPAGRPGKMPFETETEERDRIEKEKSDELKKTRERQEEINSLQTRAQMLEQADKSRLQIGADKFARMGLYLTTGTEKLSNEMIGLNRQELSELKQIKQELKRLGASAQETGLDMF